MHRAYPFLWALVIILLLMNLAILYALNQVRLTAIETLSKVEATLDGLEHEVVAYDIEVNQAVPIVANVPLNQTLEIPINTVIPIDQVLTVPFQTGSGEIEIDMPLKTNFPIDMTVPVDFNETINLDTLVELNTTVPIEVEITKTSLAGYLTQARRDVMKLRHRLTLQNEPAIEEDEPAVITPVDEEITVSGAATLQEKALQAASSGAATPTAVSVTNVTVSDEPESPSGPLDSAPKPGDDISPEPDLGLCSHLYWPLRPGTAWAYSGADSSYTQDVDGVLNNQVQLTIQRAGQNVAFDLVCHKEGLGGRYVGDSRILTALGKLEFTNPRGLFLPRPEQSEQIGTSWTQEFDVVGTIDALQGNKPIVGEVSHGQAIIHYTPTGFETLDTPLGPRDALRLEQNLNLTVDVKFDLNNKTVPVTGQLELTVVYWFVKGIGPVKSEWQGGLSRYESTDETVAVSQQIDVPAMAEEKIVSVCILLEEDRSECMQVDGVSADNVTVKPQSRLKIEKLVFPNDLGSAAQRENSELPELTNEESSTTPAETEDTFDETFDTESEYVDDTADKQAALLAYAEKASKLGDKINSAAEKFGQSALAYREGQITIDNFKDSFDSFAPKVKGYIQDAASLSAPPEAIAIHQKLANGLGQCDKAIGLMDDWFDSGDSGTKEATALLVASCIEQVTSAGNELESLVLNN